MTGLARLRRVTLVLAVVGLLVGVPAEVSRAADADQSRIRSSVAISPTGLIASRAGEPLDTRLQRDTKAEKAQRSVRQDGSTGPASHGRHVQQGAAALAAVLEWAGHPERVGHILLRGSSNGTAKDWLVPPASPIVTPQTDSNSLPHCGHA